MPTGRPHAIPFVIDMIMSHNPGSILDVGSGFGKWGMLLREYLEVWQGRLARDSWEKRIDAVEIFRGYAELPWNELFYNNIYIADVRSIDNIDEYDLVLFGDVIEHMDRGSGRTLLDKCKRYIVITPGYDSPQGEVFGNKYETHVSRWHEEDFNKSLTTKNGLIIGWN